MGFLDHLLRAMTSRPEATELDESERLRLEVVQLYQEGRFREAEQSGRRLVELQRELLGPDHPDYATALSNLALVLQQQGNLDAAEPLLRQALDVRREALGETHPDYASSLNNLALLLCERQDFDAAEPLLRQALDVRREALGEHHADYATGLGSLALLYCERHDLDAAEPLLRQALEVRRLALGEEHPDYATSLNNLALLLCERQALDEAEPLLRRALQVRREALGDQHPDTVSSSESLSMLLLRQGASSPLSTTVGEVRNHSREARDELDGARPHPIVPAPARLGRRADSSRPRTARAFAEDLADLARAFASASELLLQEAAQMQSAGIPPDLVVLSAASSCQHDFVALRSDVLALAETLLVPPNTPERVATLEELADLIETLARAESALAEREQTRRSALDMLEQVLSLSAEDSADQVHLEEAQAQARQLHTAVSNSRAFELPLDADRLSRGDHPIASLLALARDEGETSSEAWSELYKNVLAAFGQSLVVAAARGRLSIVEDASDPTPDSTSAPATLAAPVGAEAL